MGLYPDREICSIQILAYVRIARMFVKHVGSGLIPNVSNMVDLGGEQESAFLVLYNFLRQFWYSWLSEHCEENIAKLATHNSSAPLYPV